MRKIFPMIVLLACVSGCASAAKHGESLPSSKGEALTVGKVQKEIHTGMSQADVAEVLGSPNIVSKDSTEQEVWIYDKMATEAAYSHSSGFGTILLLGFNRSAGAESHSQRTLTVIIRFNKNGLVESFSYHASKF